MERRDCFLPPQLPDSMCAEKIPKARIMPWSATLNFSEACFPHQKQEESILHIEWCTAAIKYHKCCMPRSLKILCRNKQQLCSFLGTLIILGRKILSWWPCMKVCVLGSFDKALFYVFKYNCYSYSFIVVVFQSLSHVWLFAIPWTVACQPSLSFTISQSLLKLMSIESVMLSNHFILCWPLYLLPSVFPSIRIFSNKSALHIRWAKYWSFSFTISLSNEYSGLISFRVDITWGNN